MGKSLESFEDVAEHLSDIWRYGLERNRFNQGKTVHPVWQLFMQDVSFYVPADGLYITRKKKESVDPIARNISSIIGNLISISARQGLKTAQVMAQLRMLACYDLISSYYRSRGLTENDLRETITKGLLTRRLIGRAA
jgi:hypothetical protein